MELSNNNILWWILGVLNALTYLVYAIDKLLARLEWRRISERTLLLISLLGGGVGALLAMITCRHKIRKPKFWICVILAIILQCLVLYICVK